MFDSVGKVFLNFITSLVRVYWFIGDRVLTAVWTSLVSLQTVDEVLVKAGSTGCILSGVVANASDPDSATLTQVDQQSHCCDQ